MRIGIVGGGLAGCAAAYALKAAGHEPVIYEAGSALAAEASGNPVGLYNPRFGAEWSPQSQYYAAAFQRALDVFSIFDDIGFDPCGALHLITDDKKARRFDKMIESWPWDDRMMRLVDAPEASLIAGLEIGTACLYLSQSGSVHPAKLCAAYARGVKVHLNVKIDDIAQIDADVVVLAAGSALRGMDIAEDMDLRAVRGQVSMVQSTVESEGLRCHLCYGGYLSRAMDGQHLVGATFQRWLDHSDVLAQDDRDNLDKLVAAVPSFPEDLDVVGHRASVRTAARDHFPVVGEVSDGVFVSAAHGSHGILSSIMAAYILVNIIGNKPQSLCGEVIDALCPARFID